MTLSEYVGTPSYRVRSVDRVLSVEVPTLGGLPVLLDPSPQVGLTINCAAHTLTLILSKECGPGPRHGVNQW